MNIMDDAQPKSRDLDHLMEQNSTELDFLSAYGGSSSEGDGAAIFAALRRFLKAGGVHMTLNKKETSLSFNFGKASIEENGCLISFKGKNLPHHRTSHKDVRFFYSDHGGHTMNLKCHQRHINGVRN